MMENRSEYRKDHIFEQLESQSLMSCSQLCLRSDWCTQSQFVFHTGKDGRDGINGDVAICF